ncbi:MAG: amino acid permease [Gemmatimonadaceae bacterium]|nr:amino acid permease [Gemmatimonadaceae bacterium]
MSAGPDEHGDGLRAELTLLDATMINVGTMVGSAIFIVPAAIAAHFSGVFPTILVWVCGALVSLCGALCVAELGAMMPAAGGQYVYLSRAYGRVWGFLYGWSASVIINPLSIAAIAVGFATYLAYFIPIGPAGIKAAACLSIAALTLLNCFGLRLGAITQNVLTVAKIAAVVAVIALCVTLPGGSLARLTPFWPHESWSALVAPFGVAMVAVLWAFEGWIEVTYVGSEIRNPQRDMPLSIIISTVLVGLLYIALALALTWVLGQRAVAASPRVAADAMTAVLGTAGATVIAATVLVATLGSNNGIVFTAARVPYAMARQGEFWRWAGQVSERHAVPTPALLAQGAWSILLALSGRYDQLFTCIVFVAFLFYGMSCGAVLLLRRREPAAGRPYRTWGYPVTPLVFIAFALFLVVNTVRETPVESAVGVGLLVIGLVCYRTLGWHRVRPVPHA